MNALLLLFIVATSAIGTLTAAKWLATRIGWPAYAAASVAAAAWVWLWAFAVLNPMDSERAQLATCSGGNEVDEQLQRPVLMLRTPMLTDYFIVDASTPDTVKIRRQSNNDTATLNTRTGQASAMGSGAIWLCDHSSR